MLGRVVVENGVKKLVPLTADCGSGNPVGTVIAVYSNKVPNGYLPCNGVAFDTAQFPVLYALLQDDHTPDLRECTLVGIGTSDRTMGAHDVYTLGEFKDDQSQKITGRYNATGAFGSLEGAFVQTSAFEYTNGVARSGVQWSSINFDSSGSVRTGTTTHGKQVGVNWCIKATSGINENQADNVLNILQPVDTVAVDNLHSVTSNAVANALGTQYNDTAFVDITSQVTKYLGLATIQAYRKNNIVLLRMEGAYTGTPTVATQAFIEGIPAKYRPAHTQYCCGLAYKNDGGMVYACRLSVFSNGKVDMSETAFPYEASMRICMMYLV